MISKASVKDNAQACYTARQRVTHMWQDTQELVRGERVGSALEDRFSLLAGREVFTGGICPPISW